MYSSLLSRGELGIPMREPLLSQPGNLFEFRSKITVGKSQPRHFYYVVRTSTYRRPCRVDMVCSRTAPTRGHFNPTIAEKDGEKTLTAKATAHLRFRGCVIFISFAVIFIFVGKIGAEPSQLGLG